MTYSAIVDDGHGGQVSTPFTITIIGTGDRAFLITEREGLTGDISTLDQVSGTVTFTGIDLSQFNSLTSTLVSVTWSDGNILPSGLISTLQSSFSASVTNPVRFEFSATDSTFDFLGLGETLSVVYSVTGTDNNGVSSTRPVTINVTGTNDVPVITSAVADHAGGVTEDINIVSGSLVASDTITFRDVDLIDTHTATFAFTSSSSSAPLPGFTNNSTSIGVFALTTVNESNGDTVNTASLGWSFTLNDSHPVLQSLAVNQTVTQVYTVTVSDGQGGTVPQTVTVTITGTNDVPVITSGTQSGAVTEIVDHAAGENATMHTQSGAIVFTDVDTLDIHTATFSPAAGNTTTLGTFTLDLTNHDTGNGGTFGWSFLVADSAIDYLQAGQTVTQSYIVSVDDDHGGVAQKTVTITIHGTEDVPVITSGKQSGAVTEIVDHAAGENATMHTQSGAIVFTDVDTLDIHTATFSPAAGNTTTLGTFTLDSTNHDTGNGGTFGWSFLVADSAIDYLQAGQTVTQSYIVSVDDDHGGVAQKTVTITIHGTNDVPTILSAGNPATQALIVRGPAVTACIESGS